MCSRRVLCTTHPLWYFIHPLPFHRHPPFSTSSPFYPFILRLFLFCFFPIDFLTMFALTPLPLVFADPAATAVFAPAPRSLVLAEAATAAAVFADAPPPLVLADSATAAVFADAPLPLVFVDFATTTVFALAPQALLLADAAAAVVLQVLLKCWSSSSSGK